jgi:hypothetical protein
MGMQRAIAAEAEEKLIRVCAARRGTIVDLRVHYEINRGNGCDMYRIITIDEVE